MKRSALPEWLHSAIFYQVYPQSFQDSNGDGIGDLPGLIKRLDYIQSLGVNALWINPCFVSPFRDAGYDVEDYYRVAPRYGTNADLRQLFKQAHKRGIRVCLDLVAGHTSVDHPWFKESCRHDQNAFSDRYIWTQSMWDTGDGSLDFIKGYGEREGNVGVNFFWSQPALNYGFAQPKPDCPWQQSIDGPGPRAMRDELMNIMRYWIDQGADGFRVDMAFSLVKNDPKRRATIKLWQGIRQWLASYAPEAALIAEWGNPTEAMEAGFDVDFMIHYGVPGYPSLFFNEQGSIPRGACFFDKRGEGTITEFMDEYTKQYRRTRGKGYISIPSGNHDFQRPNTRRSVRDLKVLWTFLLTLPGVPFIYYGDEIGMRFVEGLSSKEGAYNRTGTRTPMQWNKRKNAGFSPATANRLYLPIDPHKKRPTVEEQDANPRSLLNHVRQLTALRHAEKALQGDGAFKPLFAEPNTYPFIYQRGTGKRVFIIALNPCDQLVTTAIEHAHRSVQRVMATGAHAEKDDNGFSFHMQGQSYGIFEVTK